MATTRIIPMHINKGKTIAQCLKERIDYAENPEKTEGGELISSYACDPETAAGSFAELLAAKKATYAEYRKARHEMRELEMHRANAAYMLGVTEERDARRPCLHGTKKSVYRYQMEL